MLRRHQIESKTFAAGNLPFSLAAIARNKRVRALQIRLELLFTHGAAAAAIAGDQLFRLISQVLLGTRVDASGLALHDLDWLQMGREAYLPAGIPATNAGTFRREITVDIPWFDPSNQAPGDLAPNSEASILNTLQVNIAAYSGLGAGTWDTLASIAGNVILDAWIDDGTGQVNPRVEIGSIDSSNKTTVLPPGLYEYVFLLNEDGSTITSAEVATVAMKADNEILTDPLGLKELVAAFNREKATAGTIRASSATAPVAGCRLTEEPAFTSGAAATVTTEFLPLIWKGRQGKLSQAVPVSNGLEIKFTGTKTAFRLVYKRVMPHDGAEQQTIFRRMGVDVRGDLGDVKPKTLSKRPLNRGWLSSVLPIRKG